MKLITFNTILLCLLNFYGEAQDLRDVQRNQISLSNTFGISTRSVENIKVDNFSVFDYRKTRTRFENAFNLKYAYRVLKNRNLFLTGGYDFTTTFLNHEIVDRVYYRHLDNIEIKSYQSTVKLGVAQQFLFYDGNFILSLNAQFLQNIPHKGQTSFAASNLRNNSSDWIEYSYQYDLFEGEFYENDADVSANDFHRINLELSIDALFKLKTGFLSFGLGYTRNHYRFYDYNAEFEYYQDNDPLPHQVYTITASNAKSIVRDHFFRLRIGYVYSF